MSLDHLSDDDLRKELARREFERKLEHARWILSKRELLLQMFQEHGRTSCSDKDTNNGSANDQGFYRCNRCALLSELWEGRTAESLAADGFSVDLSMTVKRKSR